MSDQSVVLPDEANATPREVEHRIEHAMGIVKRNMLWSAGAGILPMPLIELAAITAVEVKQIKELADYYELSFRKDLARTAVMSLIGSLGSITIGKMIAFSSLRFIPVLGPVLWVGAVPATAAAITYALGRVFISHFEAGGTLLDFDPEEMREYFRELFTQGLKEGGHSGGRGRRAAH